MKNFIAALAVFTLLIMYSCQPKGEPCPEVPMPHANGVFASTPNTTISIDTFNAWRARWESTYRSYMNTDSLHYFDMPLVDLSSITNNPAANGSRIYMGMAIESGNLSPHTMIVATVNKVSDMSQIMDYSHACPTHCPEK